MRDDIVAKIIEGLHVEFEFLEAGAVKEEATFLELDLDAISIVDFTLYLLKEFDLEDIEFSKLMEWSTVRDIVDYVELVLQEAVNDE